MPKRYERREKVSEAIKRELASLVESGSIKDDRLAPFISIIDVELSHNLATGKVSYSILGNDDPGVEAGTQAALESKTGKIRGMVARKLNLRYAPQLFFKCTDSLSKGSDLIDLIDKVNESDEI